MGCLQSTPQEFDTVVVPDLYKILDKHVSVYDVGYDANNRLVLLCINSRSGAITLIDPDNPSHTQYVANSEDINEKVYFSNDRGELKLITFGSVKKFGITLTSSRDLISFVVVPKSGAIAAAAASGSSKHDKKLEAQINPNMTPSGLAYVAYDATGTLYLFSWVENTALIYKNAQNEGSPFRKVARPFRRRGAEEHDLNFVSFNPQGQLVMFTTNYDSTKKCVALVARVF